MISKAVSWTLMPQSEQLQFWTRISSRSPPGVGLPVDPCTVVVDANQRQVVLVARPDSDCVGWTLAGREEMEDQTDPCQHDLGSCRPCIRSLSTFHLGKSQGAHF